MPDCCGHCEYCEFGPADFGDCYLTDEELWDIWNGIGKKCPLNDKKEAASE
jgi:hypothetical protein